MEFYIYISMFIQFLKRFQEEAEKYVLIIKFSRVESNNVERVDGITLA